MTRLQVNLASFRALSRQHKGIVVKASILLPCFWIGLRLFGLRGMQARQQRSSIPVGTVFSLDEAMELGNLVNIAGRHALCPVTCLTRSLLLDRMLHRRGVASQLRIGVRLSQGILDAHAWVEVAGIPVNDRSDVSEQYAVFDGTLSPASFLSP